MPLELLPALLISILLVGYSPGPANLFAFAMVLRHGRRAALRMWCGLLVGFIFAATLCVLAMHTFGVAFSGYVKYLKYVGAAYIFWLAVRMYKSRGKARKGRRACTFWSGFIVQATNAKIILYELTVYATFVLPYSERLVDLFAVAALLILAGPGANLTWLLAGSFLRHFFVRYEHAADLVMSILLGACAIWIACS